MTTESDVVTDEASDQADEDCGARDLSLESGALGLLSFLSDEELARYGDIARDQKQLEWNNALLQAVALAGSAALIFAIAAEVYAGWSWELIALTAILAGACANFPWQKHRMRRLWARHITAVEREQAGRMDQGAAEAATGESR
ncbi:MAG: hypothetical protein AAF732_00275 [Pseudomonadota bacterium]